MKRAGPSQHPEIYKVHGTAVPSPVAGVSVCKVVVVAMGSIATAVTKQPSLYLNGMVPYLLPEPQAVSLEWR